MPRPFTSAPSQRDADAIVALPKYIPRMPRVRLINRDLRLELRRIYDSAGNQLPGLVVDAHAPPPGTHRGETPRVSLTWRGVSIRCIDWEVRHEFADGSVVEGWHEHLWDDRHERNVGCPFDPPGISCDLESVFICACQHWNITIMSRQDQHLRLVEGTDDN